MAPLDETPRIPCPGGVGKKRPCWCAPGLSGCRNHAPELAEQRRQNGARRKNGPDVVIRRGVKRDAKPESVEDRPEWGPRKADVAAARQAAWEATFLEKFEEAMPEQGKARDEVQRALRAIMLTSSHVPSRVNAARVLHEIITPGKPGEEQPGMTGGSLEDELRDTEGAPPH